MSVRRFAAACGAMAVAHVLSGALLMAADLEGVLADYAVTTWDTRDGLPVGTVWSIVEGPQGYLWLATDSGVFRFDGFRFFPIIDPAAHVDLQREARVVMADSDGAIWVGFGQRGGVVRIEGQRFTEFGSEQGLPSAPIVALSQHLGEVWAATDAGLYSLVAGRWTAREVGGSREGAIWSMYAEPGTALFVASDRGVFRRVAGAAEFEVVESFATANDASEFMSSLRPGFPDHAVRSMTTTTDGHLVMSDSQTGFRINGEERSRPSSSEIGRGVRVMRDHLGKVWIATGGQGLWRASERAGAQSFDIEKISVVTGLATEGAFSLYEDSHGNVWAGGTNGLSRLTAKVMSPVTFPGVVSALALDSTDTVWVGTSEGLVALADPDAPEDFERLAEGVAIRTVTVDGDDGIWVIAEERVLRLETDGALLRAAEGAEDLLNVDALSSHPGGGVVVLDARVGVVWLDGLGGRVQVDLPGEIGDAGLLSVFVDHFEHVWVAASNGRLIQVAPSGHTTVFGPSDGATSGSYRAFYASQDGTVWAGGNQGLTRIRNGHAETLLQSGGLLLKAVKSIAADELGYLWIGTESGFVRFHPDEFDVALEPGGLPAFVAYDRTDGVAGVPRLVGDRHHAIRTRHGSLWFVTGEGVTVMNPPALPTDAALPAKIDGVVVNDLPVPSSATSQLPASTRTLRIAFGAVEMTHPRKVRFRYRMNGVDDGWVEDDGQREAFYMNLPAGRYQFQVAAANAAGRWSENPTTLPVMIAPRFYESAWFVIAMFAAVGSLAWGGWRLRLRQERSKFSLLMQERARVGREIHDTLLQGLVGVALQCEALAHDLKPTSSHLAAQFRELGAQAERYISEARHSIWELRTPVAEHLGLVQALERVARDIVGEGNATVLVTGTCDHGRLTRRIENQLVLVGREAISNAFRHARARSIRVKVDCDDTHITLQVCDDGCGFDPDEVLKESYGHFGVVSMRERIASIGGRLVIESSPTRGTCVDAIVELPERYDA